MGNHLIRTYPIFMEPCIIHTNKSWTPSLSLWGGDSEHLGVVMGVVMGVAMGVAVTHCNHPPISLPRLTLNLRVGKGKLYCVYACPLQQKKYSISL